MLVRKRCKNLHEKGKPTSTHRASIAAIASRVSLRSTAVPARVGKLAAVDKFARFRVKRRKDSALNLFIMSKRLNSFAVGESTRLLPLTKEGTQKPPFVKGAARSAEGFGNVAVMKRTFASRINTAAPPL